VGCFFTDRPLLDPSTGQTYVLFKMWGRNTEPALAALRTAFPTAKVTFRRANPPGSSKQPAQRSTNRFLITPRHRNSTPTRSRRRRAAHASTTAERPAAEARIV